ncbi:MAG TPA: glycosyltransferase family 39 protein [Polyangia bacterium]|nr:glycosyltransferase family 39 protein [Polyangia bacterium]
MSEAAPPKGRDPVDKPLWPVRAGLAVCTFIYCLYSSFGIAAPFWWGHHGYHGATYMLRARMSLRLHMISPATWGGFEAPPPAALYFHHPIGYHHLLTLLIPIFGDHEWLARGLAAAGGLVCLWALYVLVRTFWSREAGLVAVAVYVGLPMITSFSVLSDPMLPAMACVLWSLWAYLSLLEQPSTRALKHAFFAYALGGFIMWEAYFIGPFVAVHAMFYAWTARGRTLKIDTRFGRVNALWAHILVTGTACCLMMGFHLWFTHHAGVWDDFLDSYRIRHSPPSAQYVIDRHWQWVDILYGRPPLVVGAIWFALWLARIALGRARRRDIAPLTFLYVNTIYIYMFAEGSSVHLYRVFFYSGFFALAAADLASDAYGAARRLTHCRNGRAPAWVPFAVAGALVAVYLAAETPHAYRNLLESRVLMGTFGEAHYSPEQQKLRFAHEVHNRTTRDERVIIHYPELGARKEFWYYIDRNYDEIQSLAQLDKLKATQSKSVLIIDERLLSVADRPIYERLIEKHPVTYFENFTMIDLRSSTPGAQSFAFEPTHMTPAYRWFVSHKYPPLKLVRRAYLPGECTALARGVPVAKDEELVEPTDVHLMPCYHDLLVDRGNTQLADAVAKDILKPLTAVDRPLGQARILAAGMRAAKLDVAIAAGGPETGELRYQLSRDGKIAALVSPSLTVPLTEHWKAGHLYVDHVELPPGRWDVEAQLVDPTPSSGHKLLASAPLGVYVR